MPPVPRILSAPSSGEGLLRLTFESNEPEGATFKCRLDQVEQPSSFYPCTSPHTLGPVPNGSEYFFLVLTTDAAGNTGYGDATALFSVGGTPDTTLTGGPILGLISDYTTQIAGSFSFTSMKAGSTFECKYDGPDGVLRGYTPCVSPKPYGPLADGAYTFWVRATDPAGVVASPATRSFTVDTVAPDTTITSGPSGVTSEQVGGVHVRLDATRVLQLQVRPARRSGRLRRVPLGRDGLQRPHRRHLHVLGALHRSGGQRRRVGRDADVHGRHGSDAHTRRQRQRQRQRRRRHRHRHRRRPRHRRPHQHRRRPRPRTTDAHANTDADRDPDTDTDANTDADRDPDADTHANTDADRDPDAVTHANAHPYANANTDAHTLTDGHPHTNAVSDRVAHAVAHRDTHTDAHPGPRAPRRHRHEHPDRPRPGDVVAVADPGGEPRPVRPRLGPRVRDLTRGDGDQQRGGLHVERRRPGATATGRLTNGSYSLSQAILARARNATNQSAAFAPVTGRADPLTLLIYSGAITADQVTISLRQPILANEALRAGVYAKTLTFTLSTTTP